jgi:hypothetical protein
MAITYPIHALVNALDEVSLDMRVSTIASLSHTSIFITCFFISFATLTKRWSVCLESSDKSVSRESCRTDPLSMSALICCIVPEERSRTWQAKLVGVQGEMACERVRADEIKAAHQRICPQQSVRYFQNISHIFVVCAL